MRKTLGTPVKAVAIADRISVLRGGRKVATRPAAGADERGLAALMVGHDITLRRARPRAAGTLVSAAPVLELDRVCARDRC